MCWDPPESACLKEPPSHSSEHTAAHHQGNFSGSPSPLPAAAVGSSQFPGGRVPPGQTLLMEWLCAPAGTVPMGFRHGNYHVPKHPVLPTHCGCTSKCRVGPNSCRLCLRPCESFAPFLPVIYLLVCSGMGEKVGPHTCSALVWYKRVWFSCSVYNV